MCDRGFAVPTEEMHIRMRPHHIPINLLYHLGILQYNTPSCECATCIYDLQAVHLHLEVCMPRAVFMLIEGVVIHTIFKFLWVHHKFLHEKNLSVPTLAND